MATTTTLFSSIILLRKWKWPWMLAAISKKKSNRDGYMVNYPNLLHTACLVTVAGFFGASLAGPDRWRYFYNSLNRCSLYTYTILFFCLGAKYDEPMIGPCGKANAGCIPRRRAYCSACCVREIESLTNFFFFWQKAWFSGPEKLFLYLLRFQSECYYFASDWRALLWMKEFFHSRSRGFFALNHKLTQLRAEWLLNEIDAVYRSNLIER